LKQVEELGANSQAVPAYRDSVSESGEKATSDTKKYATRLTENNGNRKSRELDAKKKKKETAGSITEELSPEEKKLLANQDEQR
jgi:hypothetical protein